MTLASPVFCRASFLQRLLWAETVAFFSFPPLVFSAACLGLEWERRESRVPPASSCQIVSEPWLSLRRNPLLAFPKNGFCLAFSPAFSGKIWCASNRAWKRDALTTYYGRVSARSKEKELPPIFLPDPLHLFICSSAKKTLEAQEGRGWERDQRTVLSSSIWVGVLKVIPPNGAMESS